MILLSMTDFLTKADLYAIDHNCYKLVCPDCNKESSADPTQYPELAVEHKLVCASPDCWDYDDTSESEDSVTVKTALVLKKVKNTKKVKDKSILDKCIETEIPELVDFKKEQQVYVNTVREKEGLPSAIKGPNTFQIVETGGDALEQLEHSRKSMRRIQAFINQWYPEDKGAIRAMAKALEACHKTEALLKEALEACHLSEGDFTE
jgi:hypothetical protein